MTETPENQSSTTEKVPFYRRFKKPGKQLFWLWIGYQCVKGMATTIFIWAPLVYLWWQNTH